LLKTSTANVGSLLSNMDNNNNADNHMDTDMGDLPVPMLSSKQTPVTPEQLMVRLGEMVLALLLGEIIHRIILIFEELPHVKERYNGNRGEMFWAVISNCHNQVIFGPLLTIFGFGLVGYGSSSFSSQIVVNVASVALVYVGLRAFGAMDNSLEDMQVLEEKNALLGPGLATNYWFSYLKWICTGEVSSSSGHKDLILNDLKEALETTKASTESGEEEYSDINRDGLMLNKMARQGENFRVFPKLIILLPSRCWRPKDIKTQDSSEGVFQYCDPSVLSDASRCNCSKGPCKCNHSYCSHDYQFRIESQQRRAPIKATVHWIYENEEDEKTHPNPRAKKIFVMFDFPMLLQSAMGPGRDLEDNASARIRNIETFEETLRKFLASNEYLRYNKLVTFHSYNNEDETEGEKKSPRSLASRLRDRVNLEKQLLL